MPFLGSLTFGEVNRREKRPQRRRSTIVLISTGLISTGLIPRSLLRYSGSYEPIYP
jgi:hypothetical protein